METRPSPVCSSRVRLLGRTLATTFPSTNCGRIGARAWIASAGLPGMAGQRRCTSPRAQSHGCQTPPSERSLEPGACHRNASASFGVTCALGGKCKPSGSSRFTGRRHCRPSGPSHHVFQTPLRWRRSKSKRTMIGIGFRARHVRRRERLRGARACAVAELRNHTCHWLTKCTGRARQRAPSGYWEGASRCAKRGQPGPHPQPPSQPSQPSQPPTPERTRIITGLKPWSLYHNISAMRPEMAGFQVV